MSSADTDYETQTKEAFKYNDGNLERQCNELDTHNRLREKKLHMATLRMRIWRTRFSKWGSFLGFGLVCVALLFMGFWSLSIMFVSLCPIFGSWSWFPVNICKDVSIESELIKYACCMSVFVVAASSGGGHWLLQIIKHMRRSSDE